MAYQLIPLPLSNWSPFFVLLSRMGSVQCLVYFSLSLNEIKDLGGQRLFLVCIFHHGLPSSAV